MKITNYRRTRNVKMSDLPESLRLRMAANGVEFQVRFPEDAEDQEQLVREVEAGAYQHTQGLYSLSYEADDHFDDDTDQYVSQVDFTVRFEEYDDLVKFEKNFILIFKLSN
jgi:hypothetical protein